MRENLSPSDRYALSAGWYWCQFLCVWIVLCLGRIALNRPHARWRTHDAAGGRQGIDVAAGLQQGNAAAAGKQQGTDAPVPQQDMLDSRVVRGQLLDAEKWGREGRAVGTGPMLEGLLLCAHLCGFGSRVPLHLYVSHPQEHHAWVDRRCVKYIIALCIQYGCACEDDWLSMKNFSTTTSAPTPTATQSFIRL